jgi:hypothetical protein
VYSKSGFITNDSTEITGGVDQSNAAVTGSFATPITLANQTSGPANYYRLALNGSTGVTIADGQTLTIRLYYACSSTGTPRYAMLKNVSVKGEALGTLPLNVIDFNASYSGEVTNLNWRSVNESGISVYQVERSLNGSDFIALGTITADGSSKYVFTDKIPAEGLNYYRLKLLSKDGKVSYSKVLLINTRIKASISAYPNPATSQLTLVHPRAGNNNAVIRLFSIDNKMISAIPVQASSIQSTLNIAGLVKGFYFLVYSDGAISLSAKFIKQ